MIDFELLPSTKMALKGTHGLAAGLFRKIARYYDDHEHEKVQELYDMVENMAKATPKEKKKEEGKEEKPKPAIPMEPSVAGVVTAEEMAWGDAGIMLCFPLAGLGNAAIQAVGTPEQKARLGGKFTAMAITEPGAGSDTAAITTTAKLDPDTNEWIINGEKIFITSGDRCESVVVWATLDKSMGRAAIKSFVVEKGTPGMTVTKVEDKLGIRASDTASILFEDSRIPYDNILGSPEVKEKKKGLGGAMATFDATRPGVAAMAIGVARAALEFTKEQLEAEGYTFPYNLGQHQLNAVQRDVLEMEANLEVARLLVWRASSMMDKGIRNSLEASMSKAKAGRAATLVTQKCVDVLGSKAYSCDWLLEKWMRDCKINDIFEGTGQIQMLIIARNILGFGRDRLK
ncbi:MAG: acyl-CoA dehydrogenase family protein [Deltaproteobacteria bacterium]|nr:acyl-CoA dehydrogenase family protein [Deltaproteobacteria bacterium]MBW2052246.1 acyl-CoA dehydrogenase family protein [Deltaproteobacteria bacterium]MBW2141146.1 acyl-CoA dehydrogenase family protein [Deltaproteobacteria bacterium]MBW2323097.1 acyl-CoA dehydrogenase family protein [Deltaproteobacteria bacterium]